MSADICLVNMPYTSLTHPSLALGLIETYIREYQHQPLVIYGNLEFAKNIGLEAYCAIDNSHFEQLIGEWTFSRAAFPEKTHDDDGFFSLFTDMTDQQKQQLYRVRDFAETYVITLAKQIIESSPKIVACTSTFQQNCASLALLRQLKSQNPNIITLLGGANCESVMGQTISESFPWVDYVFSGECDAVIGDFVDKLIRGVHIGSHNLPHGFIAQGSSDLLITESRKNKTPPRGYIEDMTQVKTPNYDTYFATVEQLELQENIIAGLLLETSRGCWWGAKKHCTFCGLNGVSMEHRCKPAATVLEEFKTLSSKYNNFKFEIVDNILPMEYMKTLLPELSKEQSFTLFYETKSNLKKEHIEQIAAAGIKWVQPGFESLHDDFLKLIDKGVTGIQNVSALKWFRNYGIHVFWNVLCGAPHEDDKWYEEIAEVVPLISHLQPPYSNMLKILFPRFSPYFKTPEKYGLTLEPAKSYQYIYPLSGDALFNIAYFFREQTIKTTNIFSLNSRLPFDNLAHNNLQAQLDTWSNQWAGSSFPLLYMSDQGENIVVIDTRKVATNITHQLSGLTADIYRLCAEPITFTRLKTKLNEITVNMCDDDIALCLEKLINDKLLLSMSHCYLALALKGNTPQLPSYKDRPAGYLNLRNN